MQDCSIPIVNALDIQQSYNKPSIWANQQEGGIYIYMEIPKNYSVIYIKGSIALLSNMTSLWLHSIIVRSKLCHVPHLGYFWIEYK